MATIRRKRNLISTIKKDESILTEPVQIRKAIIQHFKQLYESQETTFFDLSSLGLNKITPEVSAWLQEPVSSVEVKEALMSCDMSKAPGYDGFNIKCLKHVWPIIGRILAGISCSSLRQGS